MSKDNDKPTIERVHMVEAADLSSPIDLSKDLADKKAKGNDTGLILIAAEKDGFWHRAIKKLIETIAGENKVGKGIGQVKDAVSYLFPAARILDAVTDPIGEAFKTEPSTKHQPTMNWFINRFSEKTTWRGIIAVATAAGLAISPDQATAIVATGVALAGLVEAFTKEPQSADKS